MKTENAIYTFLVLCLLSSAICAAEVEDLPKHSFLRAIMQTAARNKLNVIVAAADREYSGTTAAGLEEIAAATDCSCIEVGPNFLVVDSNKRKDIEKIRLKILQPQNCPADCIVADLQKSATVKPGVAMISEANSLLLYGYEKETTEVEKAAQKLDFARPLLAIHLDSIKFNHISLPEVTFLTYAEIPAVIEIAKFGKISLKIEKNEEDGFSLMAGFSRDYSASTRLKIGKIGDVNQSSGHGQFKQTNDFPVSGNWRVEVIKKPQPKKPVSTENSGQASSKPKQPQEEFADDSDMIRINALREPIGEVCGRIAAAAGVNNVCGEAGMNEISVFMYGEKLYYEELLNLIAKATGLASRKIGNTWLMAPVGQFHDAMDFSLSITRRLKYADLLSTMESLRRIFSQTGIQSSAWLREAKANNAVICGGSSAGIEIIEKYLKNSDTPPLLISTKLRLERGKNVQTSEQTIPSGKAMRLEMESAGEKLTTEITPFHFEKAGLIAARYLCRLANDKLQMTISGMTELNSETALARFATQQESSLVFYFSAQKAEKQLQNFHRNAPDSDLEPADSDVFETSF